MTAPALLDRVRARLALEPGRADAGPGSPPWSGRRPAGCWATTTCCVAVRNAVDELAGAGPLEPLLRTPGVTDVLVNGPEQVWVDRGAGLERTRGAVRRRRRRAPARRPAGRRRRDDGSTTRRRGWTPDCPTAPACTPSWRRCRAAAPASPCASCAGARLTLDELAALGTLPGESGALLRALVARPARLPGHRRHRLGEDHAAVGAAGRGRPRRTAWCSARTPPSSRPRTRTSSGCSPGRRTSRASVR